jgi:hypothetical protein
MVAYKTTIRAGLCDPVAGYYYNPFKRKGENEMNEAKIKEIGLSIPAML